MNYHVITIFPDMLSSYFAESIMASAIKNKIINIKTYALREYTDDKHRRVDGIPYGGGPGMVMWVDPIVNCAEKIKSDIEKKYQKELKSYELKKEKYSDKTNLKNKIKLDSLKKTEAPKILFVHFDTASPKFTTQTAKDISINYADIIFICGRYEGIDARVNEIYPGLNISIGDYVLTGGELPAMVCIDSISRQIEGVLNKSESLEENRISASKVYARPEIYEYKTKIKVEIDKKEVKTRAKTITKIVEYSVPKVLLSGNHKEIDKWRSENR